MTRAVTMMETIRRGTSARLENEAQAEDRIRGTIPIPWLQAAAQSRPRQLLKLDQGNVVPTLADGCRQNVRSLGSFRL